MLRQDPCVGAIGERTYGACGTIHRPRTMGAWVLLQSCACACLKSSPLGVKRTSAVWAQPSAKARTASMASPDQLGICPTLSTTSRSDFPFFPCGLFPNFFAALHASFFMTPLNPLLPLLDDKSLSDPDGHVVIMRQHVGIHHLPLKLGVSVQRSENSWLLTN